MAEKMKNQECVKFLDAEANKMYKCYLSSEDARRVSTGNSFLQKYSHFYLYIQICLYRHSYTKNYF